MTRPPSGAWTRALAGDRDAFQEAVAPLQDELLDAARTMLHVQPDAGGTGSLDDGPAPDAAALTPEELVGEALVRAWERRDHFDADRLSFRAWMLGLQTRALARFTRQEALYTQGKSISLDAEVPANEGQDAVGEALYEFRQPFDVTTYGDLVAGSAPADIGTDGFSEAGIGGTGLDASDLDTSRLTDAQLGALRESDVSPVGRTALLLHDEFALPLDETAQILNASLKDTASALNLARVTLREAIGSAALPDDPSDAVDSYTGDPV